MKYTAKIAAVLASCAVVALQANAQFLNDLLDAVVADIESLPLPTMPTLPVEVERERTCIELATDCVTKCRDYGLKPFINYCVKAGSQTETKCHCMALNGAVYDNNADLDIVKDAASSLMSMVSDQSCASGSHLVSMYHGRGEQENPLAWYMGNNVCLQSPIDEVLDASAPVATVQHVEVDKVCDNQREVCARTCQEQGGLFATSSMKSFMCSAASLVELSSFNAENRADPVDTECVCTAPVYKSASTLMSTLGANINDAYQQHANDKSAAVIFPALALIGVALASLLVRRKRAAEQVIDLTDVVAPNNAAKIVETTSYSFADADKK